MRNYDFADVCDLVDAFPFTGPYRDMQSAAIDAIMAYTVFRDRGESIEQATAAVEADLDQYIVRGDDAAYSYACIRDALREFIRCCDRPRS